MTTSDDSPKPDKPQVKLPAPRGGRGGLHMPSATPNADTAAGVTGDAAPTARAAANPLIDPKALLAVRSKLMPSEQVLWAAKPDPSSIAKKSFGWSALIFPVLAAWTVVKRHYLKSSSSDADPLTTAMIVGAVLIIGSIIAWVALKAKARTMSYVLTDSRAIIVMGKWAWYGEKTIALGRGEVTLIHVSEKETGSGSIALSKGLMKFAGGAWLPKGFMGIQKVKTVESLLRSHPIAPSAATTAPFYTRLLTGM